MAILMGVSVVVTSGKGGVGKSTVALGLGRSLAQKGRRVLLDIKGQLERSVYEAQGYLYWRL